MRTRAKQNNYLLISVINRYAGVFSDKEQVSTERDLFAQTKINNALYFSAYVLLGTEELYESLDDTS